MLLEISCATDFLGRYVASCTPQIIDAFKTQVSALMKEKYTNHWDPQRPHYGNGYRAITSFGGMLDPILCEAARRSELPLETLATHIPRDFVLWVEPFSVSFRIGDHGVITTIYDNTPGKTPVKVDPLSPPQKPLARVSHAVRISPPPSPPNHTAKVSHAIPIISPGTKSQVLVPRAAPSPPASSK
ncbi:Protein Tob2, partial [Mortierella sp. NVP85]